MSRAVRLLTAASLVGLVSACTTPTAGPPPMGRPVAEEPDRTPFRAEDFAWSQVRGKAQLAGRLTYRQGPVRYTCAGATVVLTPETPWSRRRMEVLYRSAERAALPSDKVRARTPLAPPGDAGPFIKRAICDASDKFSYAGLADGAWFMITVARPATGPGETVALMRRVVTKAGKLSVTEF